MDMEKICLNCQFIGKGKYNYWYGNIYLAIPAIIVGIFLLINTEVFGSTTLTVISGLFIIIIGILNIVQYLKGGIVCPKCKKQTMTSVNTPEAQKLIKENNLSISE